LAHPVSQSRGARASRKIGCGDVLEPHAAFAFHSATLTIGDPAPEFSLSGVCQDARRHYSPHEYTRALARVVILADFTFDFPTEVAGFSRRAAEFGRDECAICGVSVDSCDSHEAWARELDGVAYPLLSDDGCAVSRTYHVLHPREPVALRATFIIDPHGVNRYAIASNMNVGRSVEETLRVLRALRTGRRCPADWKRGEESGDRAHHY
jgi:peroxiredoxin 2/4